MYYNQPMPADIAREFHAGRHEAGLIATATQVGYAAAMPLFHPAWRFRQPLPNRATIGSILTGVLLGILLARTVSGVVFAWRAMFWLACAVAGLFAVVLRRGCPTCRRARGFGTPS